MKKILGLDLGTNSIGWSVINSSDDNVLCGIEAANSRIIPMTADVMGKFERGNSESQTKERTQKRGTRRLRERFILRRERLLRVLDHIKFLPSHYSSELDRYGKFIDYAEPKIAYVKNENRKYQFLFLDSFNEMPFEAEEFAKTKDKSIIWEGHRVGRRKAYCHIEKLTNLDSIPNDGYTIYAMPIPVKGCSAGWCRVVAIL
ncbi:MAG: hypothetical protein HUJ97_01960 [Bacteroidales bacterium]|nr:hypothetical protein [Bacteroidales bacterium]